MWFRNFCSPQEAIQGMKAVAAAIPQLSVIGIAGPGDPLANMARTCDTPRGLRSALPDVKLCVFRPTDWRCLVRWTRSLSWVWITSPSR